MKNVFQNEIFECCPYKYKIVDYGFGKRNSKDCLKIFEIEYQDKLYKDAFVGIFLLSILRCEEPHATFLVLVIFNEYLEKATVTLMNEMQSLVFEEGSFVFQKSQTTSTFWLYRSIKSALLGCFLGQTALKNVLRIKNC